MDLVVGRIVKAHGVTGELVVEIKTDEPEQRFAVGNQLQLSPPRHARAKAMAVASSRGGHDGPPSNVVIQSVRPHGSRLLVRLVGVSDRDSADALRGHLFLIDSAALPPIADPDEFYDYQLQGLTVRTVQGRHIGVVADVLHTGAGELLSVRCDDGTELLVPFVAAIVTSISLSTSMIEIDPPEGLLNLGELT